MRTNIATRMRSASRLTPALRVTLGLFTFDLRRYLIGAALWWPVSVLPLAGGLVLQKLFDRISGHRAAGLAGPLWLCAAFVGVELVRGVTMVVAWTYGVYWWEQAATTLRANVLRSLLTARGPAARRMPHSSAESFARLRDDVEQLVEFADESVPLVGAVLFGLAALGVMAAVDPVAAVVVVLPVLAVIVLSRLLSRVVRRLHQCAQTLGAAVTAWIGEAFGGVLAIKTAGAEEAVLARLREHNRARRDAAIRDRLVTDLLGTATGASAQLGIGLVLLLAAPGLRRGDFTLGDLALFTSYVGWLTALPDALGRVLYRLPQAEVSTERLSRLMARGEGPDDLAVAAAERVDRIAPEPEPRESVLGDEDRLELLEVRNLTARHPAGGHGVSGIDLDLPRGSVTAVTGPVGAGKTTLLRALLGLLAAQDGTVAWNGRPIDDPGGFLVPPRAAYVSQLPRLFSAELRENLLLGEPDTHLARALWLAALDADVAAMPQGLGTVVGSRGVRLSGGQVQRATAARALARMPQLLVVDDLSSALDVETERLLWDRICGAVRAGTDTDGPAALLVVSHRRSVLERADQVVVLDQGTVTARGMPASGDGGLSVDELEPTDGRPGHDCAPVARIDGHAVGLPDGGPLAVRDE
jgi:ATP-binding cassette subfamily B protein